MAAYFSKNRRWRTQDDGPIHADRMGGIAGWTTVAEAREIAVRRRIAKEGEAAVKADRDRKKDKVVTRQITINGETRSMSEWARMAGITLEAFRKRLSTGKVGADLIAEKLPRGRSGEKIDINGESKTIKEWSELCGISISLLRSRCRSGVRGEALLAPPKPPGRISPGKPAKKHTYDNQSLTIKEWASATGIGASKIRVRLFNGWTLGQALGFESRPASSRKVRSKNKKSQNGEKNNKSWLSYKQLRAQAEYAA